MFHLHFFSFPTRMDVFVAVECHLTSFQAHQVCMRLCHLSCTSVERWLGDRGPIPIDTKKNRSQSIHPGKLTCPLKRYNFNRKYIFQPSIFRGHVSFRGSTCWYIIYKGLWLFFCWLSSTKCRLFHVLFFLKDPFNDMVFKVFNLFKGHELPESRCTRLKSEISAGWNAWTLNMVHVPLRC